VRRRVILVVGAVVATGALAWGAVAYATGESEQKATGPKADRASAAALDATGGGTATSVELDGEHGATWEVEVTKLDGSRVDVSVDANFKVVHLEGEGASSDGNDSNG
jgi:hypothetical protein